MRRRDFIAFGGAAIAWPRPAQASEMRRIAVLTTFGDSDALAQGWDAAFRKGLDESGWHDGRNVAGLPAMPVDPTSRPVD